MYSTAHSRRKRLGICQRSAEGIQSCIQCDSISSIGIGAYDSLESLRYKVGNNAKWFEPRRGDEPKDHPSDQYLHTSRIKVQQFIFGTPMTVAEPSCSGSIHSNPLCHGNRYASRPAE